ncbi:substrate-binding periplasmic protein [Pseudomonas profundi]|uniref:substrate-binding periplasmic protein n=1 Tax=Pseudomonas profundi TaxID=1981513 RepID=UPI00123BEC02|nr:transporter substrate-binding domain-containing protein [Pseudomonas profundi]
MKRWAKSSLAAMMLLGTGHAYSAEGACERIVVTGNPQYPPVLWVDPEDEDKLIGAGVELLELALEGTGIAIEVMNTGPWSRAQEEARSGRVDMLAGAFLTPERLAFMDYVYPSYVEIPSVLFVRKGQAFPYGGWDDLQSKRGSTLVDNSFGSAFDTYAKTHLDIERVPSVEQSFESLLSDRADYVVYERYQGLAVAEKLGITDELDVLEGSLINENLYYTVSHNSACNSPALRSALALGMHKVVNQGEPRRLLEKYRNQWASQFMPEKTEGEPGPGVSE